MIETKPKERPIICSGARVLALLGGYKTQSRRVVKPQSKMLKGTYSLMNGLWYPTTPSGKIGIEPPVKCPYGKIGDVLWVRETFFNNNEPDKRELEHIYYRADGQPDFDGETVESEGGGWCSPLFMPRWASRLSLTITDIRVERLQDITEADAMAEGIQKHTYDNGCYCFYEDNPMEHMNTAVDMFRLVWDDINGDKPGRKFSDNPWVWVLTLKKDAPA